MSQRSSVRFIQKERMKQAGLTKICKPDTYDGVNECYRSKFAMHWRTFPNMTDIPFIRKNKPKYTKRNLNTGKRVANQ